MTAGADPLTAAGDPPPAAGTAAGSAAGRVAAARVTALLSYPIKGCAGVPHSSAAVGRRGLPHDREFMLVEPDGRFLSQRRDPLLAVLVPEVSADGGTLTVSAPGHDPLRVGTRLVGPRLAVSVHAWDGAGIDQGDAAADWFGTVLGRACRLVRVPADHDEQRLPEVDPRIVAGFADAHPLLIVAESSLAELNRRLVAAGEPAIPMNRFRPNIVLGGWAEPHREDHIRRAEIGGLTVEYERDCIRCAVPTVDQATGRRTGIEPTRTLATYRRHPDGGVAFGMKAVVHTPGTVAVGDPVRVHETAPAAI